MVFLHKAELELELLLLLLIPNVYSRAHASTKKCMADTEQLEPINLSPATRTRPGNEDNLRLNEVRHKKHYAHWGCFLCLSPECQHTHQHY